jgi:hypothetical protein
LRHFQAHLLDLSQEVEVLLQLLVVAGHLLYGLLFPTGESLQLFLLEAVDFLVDGSEEQVGLRLAL